MGKTKGEHFVPQCYLKMFTDNGKLNVYDKEKKEIRINQPISEIAKQKVFYDFSPDELSVMQEVHPEIDNVQHIEEFFKTHVETDLKKLLDSLQLMALSVQDDDQCDQLPDELKKSLSIQMAYQFLRTQKLRHYLSKLKSLNASFVHKYMLISSSMATDWAEPLRDFKWIVEINKTSIPFYTSDSPLCICYGPTNTIGSEDEGFEKIKIIRYPISANICVALVNINENVIPSTLFIPIEDECSVMCQNAFQYQNAERYVFSRANYDDIEKLVRFSDSFKAIGSSSIEVRSLLRIFDIVYKMLTSGNIDTKEFRLANDFMASLVDRLASAD